MALELGGTGEIRCGGDEHTRRRGRECAHTILDDDPGRASERQLRMTVASFPVSD